MHGRPADFSHIIKYSYDRYFKTKQKLKGFQSYSLCFNKRNHLFLPGVGMDSHHVKNQFLKLTKWSKFRLEPIDHNNIYDEKYPNFKQRPMATFIKMGILNLPAPEGLDN